MRMSNPLVLPWANRPFFHKPDAHKASASGGARRGPRPIGLRPGELSLPMVAEKLDVPSIKLHNAVRSGKLVSFIARTTTYGRGTAYIFWEKDLSMINAALARRVTTKGAKRTKTDPDQISRGPIALNPGELTAIMLADRLGINKNTVKRAINDGRLAPFVNRTVPFGEHIASIFLENDLESIRQNMRQRQQFALTPKRRPSAETRADTSFESIEFPENVIAKGTTIGRKSRSGSISVIGELIEALDLKAGSKFPGMIQCKLEWHNEYIRPEDLMVRINGAWKTIAGL